MKLSRASIPLLVIQLAIVSSIAAKYLYQRWTCPRAWTRAVAYDPELVMRGRYISSQLHIDACGVTLPVDEHGPKNQFDRRVPFKIAGTNDFMLQLPVIVGVKDGKLAVTSVAKDSEARESQDLEMRTGATCHDAMLQQPVNFYLSETAKSPFPLASGQELWVEVTVPPKGPPRPIALALKSTDGKWQPLDYQ